jgi:hypothetical protein
MKSTPRPGWVHSSGARLGSYPPTTTRSDGDSERRNAMICRAVRRWNVITDKPTISGRCSRTSRLSASATDDCARMRSATAT